METKNYLLNVGLNDKDKHEQLKTLKEVYKMLATVIKEGCTITNTIGIYKGEIENSLKIEVYDIPYDTIKFYADVIVTWLNQESIIITDMTTNKSEWVYHA